MSREPKSRSKRPSKRRVAKPPFDVAQLIADLEAVYGKSYWIPRFEPIEELVSCILSQHSADANSFPAFMQLRAEYPEWAEVEAMDRGDLAGVIRAAGLANQKAKSIQESLRRIREEFGSYTLEPLRDMSDEEATAWLLSLPGVGRKTAAIVLCFAYGRHVIPVDTHIHRVSMRLGLIGEKTTADQAHDDLLRVVPNEIAFAYHTTLIQHGRMICMARNPRCPECPVPDRCKFYKRTYKVSSKEAS